MFVVAETSSSKNVLNIFVNDPVCKEVPVDVEKEYAFT